MKKAILFCFGIVSLIALLSCEPKSDLIPEPEKVTTEAPVQKKIVATVTGDSLRVREMPYLDAEILGHLMTGDQVLVETRTDWTETIGDLDSVWYFVRTDSYSGWTYGGFLNFGGSNPSSVAIDPGVVPRSPEFVETPLSVISRVLDPSTLPEILLPVFGFEGEPGIEDTREGVITYDPIYEYLVIPFSGLAESRLRAFVDEEVPGKLRLIAESPGSSVYEREYDSGEYQLFSDSSLPDTDNDTDFSDAILIPFFRLATLDAGFWEIYAFIGSDNWPVAVGKVNIVPSEISIVPVSDPDPMRHSPRSRYSRNDTAFAFGSRKGGQGNLQVALYNDSGEYSDGKILLRPASAVQVQADSKGFWSAEFFLGDTMPEGRCWAASGDPIEGLANLHLFITSLEL